MKESLVYVLQIDHRHGTDISVHATKEGAEAAIFRYVAEWWETDGPMTRKGERRRMPKNHDAAVRAYFDEAEDESAEIHTCEIEGAEVAA